MFLTFKEFRGSDKFAKFSVLKVIGNLLLHLISPTLYRDNTVHEVLCVSAHDTCLTLSQPRELRSGDKTALSYPRPLSRTQKRFTGLSSQHG